MSDDPLLQHLHEPEAEIIPPTKPPRDSLLALAALLAGIISVPFLCCFPCGTPMQLAAGILGALALSDINAKPEVGGEWMAWTGIGCAVGSLIVGILLFVTNLAAALVGPMFF